MNWYLDYLRAQDIASERQDEARRSRLGRIAAAHGSSRLRAVRGGSPRPARPIDRRTTPIT